MSLYVKDILHFFQILDSANIYLLYSSYYSIRTITVLQ